MSTIKIKRSGVSAQTPSTLEHGELALNYADGKLFYKDATNAIAELSTGGGTGGGLDSAGVQSVLGGLESIIIGLGASETVTSASGAQIAIGEGAGAVQNSIALGANAFAYQNGVAIGHGSHQGNNGHRAVVIGSEAGSINTGFDAVVIGYQAGGGVASGSYPSQRHRNVYVGGSAGASYPGAYSVAIGWEAGKTNHGGSSVAIGAMAGQTNQGDNNIIINATGGALDRTDNFGIDIRTSAAGSLTYSTDSDWVFGAPVTSSEFKFTDGTSMTTAPTGGGAGGGLDSAAIGGVEFLPYKMRLITNEDRFSIGQNANVNNNGEGNIAIGFNASANGNEGAISLGKQSSAGGYQGLALGVQASANADYSISVGMRAGASGGTKSGILIGYQCGLYMSNSPSEEGNVFIGRGAGSHSSLNQAANFFNRTVAIGEGVAIQTTGQTADAIAIGYSAGQVNMGSNSINIGKNAGKNDAGDNSITVNATGLEVSRTDQYAIDIRTSDSGSVTYSTDSDWVFGAPVTSSEFKFTDGTSMTTAPTGGGAGGGLDSAAVLATVGIDSSSISLGALADPSTFPDTVAIGHKSRASGNGGVGNTVAIGSNAQTDKNFSTAIGANSWAQDQSCTAIGAGTEASGQQSTAIGSNCSSEAYSFAGGRNCNATGSSTVAIGNTANATAQDGIIIGSNAGTSSSKSNPYGICIGFRAGNKGFNSSAILIGKDAGYASLASMPGENSIALGVGAGVGSGENTISIGEHAGYWNTQGNFSNNAIFINASGSTGQVRKIQDHYAIDIRSNDSDGHMWFSKDSDWNFGASVNVNGDVNASGDITAFSTSVSSDPRLKTDIVKIDNAVEKVQMLNGVSWDWTRGGRSAGVLSTDVAVVLPEAVTTGKIFGEDTEYDKVNYNALIGLLVEAVKELQEEVNELKNKE